MQFGELSLEQQVEMAGAGNIAGAAGAGARWLQRFRHGREHCRVLAHAEIIVGAPHGRFGADAMIVGARKAAAPPLSIGEDAIAPLAMQRFEAFGEKAS